MCSVALLEKGHCMGVAEPWVAILMNVEPSPEFRRDRASIGEEMQIPSSVMMMSLWLI